MPTMPRTNRMIVSQRQSPTSGQCSNSSNNGRGSISAQAIARMTVVWISSVLRSQIVTIDQVSALKKPTVGDR